MNDEIEYVDVPTYIEKAIKKLFKLQNTEKELVAQIKDYMETHDIPTDTPLALLKHIPDVEVHPNQMALEINENNIKKI